MINKTNEWYIIKIIGMINYDSGGYNERIGGLSGSVIVYYI